ncbi:hypothetical protein [Aurantibacillus circumpalustris]|uniref:hypothetical protein n=1 Tax=Aurantibacillus circumpalustris TaxID=3036359 RepID=UPI00295AA3A6|nr:hypothetical protein [Aurantibacillus circumpalustris]
MKLLFKIISFCLFSFFISQLFSCKKDKLITDSGAKIEFSQDSVLFDTVFTTIGSATQNIRVRNKNNQRIKISSIQLQGGNASQFIVNVDGAKGTSFTDIEIAANDSMYIFIQVNVNPTNINSPLIISDALIFLVNGNQQKLNLEAWGQDAYYHRPDSVIKFKDGSYFPYSLANAVPNSYNLIGDEFVWKNDKPHVVYGYLVVNGPDSITNEPAQNLKILEGTKIFMNYKSGIWVYAGARIQVLGKKGQEVVFQGARREKDFADEPGQWDRIWINEGSNDNIINYAIIKNGFIGVQCEFIGEDPKLSSKGVLRLTNTKIQNMSLWGLYCLYYGVFGFNNVISNCQEHSVNILLGGEYIFSQCTFANYWSKDKSRDKPTLKINNYSETQVLPLSLRISNCIIDGKLENEVSLDIKTPSTIPNAVVSYTFSNNWLKSTMNTSDVTIFINNRKGDKTAELEYEDKSMYNFEPKASEKRITGFTGTLAKQDASIILPAEDINGKPRNVDSVTAGAYEAQ